MNVKHGYKLAIRAGIEAEEYYFSFAAMPALRYELGKWTLPEPADGGLSVFTDLLPAIQFAEQFDDDVVMTVFACDYIPARFQVLARPMFQEYWFGNGTLIRQNGLTLQKLQRQMPWGTAIADAVRPTAVVIDDVFEYLLSQEGSRR